MPIDPSALTAGPRGRRMLLEFAVRSEALASGDVTQELPLWKALFDHSIASGEGAVGFGWGEEYVPRRTTAADLAARLAAVPLVRARPSLLLDALQRAAVSAAGHQPLDEVDHLLAGWRLDQPLARIAAQVAATSKSGWWSRPVDRDEQFLALPARDERGQRRRPRPAAKVLAAKQNRPGRAWWTAPPRELTVTTRRWPRRGPIGTLVREDDDQGGRFRVDRLVLPRSAKVYEVATADDWMELCRRFGTAAMPGPDEWTSVTAREGEWVVPDWRAVARKYQAVHLTVQAWLSASGRELVLDERTSSLLTGWNPDETFWLCDPSR